MAPERARPGEGAAAGRDPRTTPRRVLLVRLSAVGDVVNVLPSVGLVRAALPDAHLAFAVEDRAADLVRDHPLLDEAIVFPRRRWREALASGIPARIREAAAEASAYRRGLRDRRFDVSLDFQGNLKGAMHAWASRAPRRIGFAPGHDREMSWLFANERVVPPADRPHRVEKFASLAAALGASDGPLEFRLPESTEVRRRVDRALAEARVAPGFVCLHPGTSGRGEAKRWPAARFGELAARLRAERDVAVLVTRGPGEEALAREVERASGGVARLAPATGSLLDLAEVLRRASLFVSGDTGPMHLAAACGTRCVALFGPKDPAVYRPWGSGHVVLRGPGRSGRPPAMDEIEVAAVVRAVSSVLDAPRGAD
ncbi:MAG: glycosyltransferase family 9 protein [Planctomycetes bacterium]|nr:glycosyltransferase family 9 protein [Planctomycetota bacterium]